MTSNQQTIASSIRLSGIGVHSGEMAHITLCPAPTNTGRIFVSTTDAQLPASHLNLLGSNLQTTLGNTHFLVQTPEHLLAAAYLMKIDNLIIRIDGPEVPILDGSALPWVCALQRAGLQKQTEQAQLFVPEPTHIELGNSLFTVQSSKSLILDVTIDFDHPKIGRLQNTFEEEDQLRELAPAQTFGFLSDLPRLKNLNLAKGADLLNTLVFDETNLKNPNKQRFINEALHHKALDIIGDISLLNRRVKARISSFCPSHALTHSWLQKLDRISE